MTKGQMRSIEAILAVILILIAYSKITGPLYQNPSPTRSLSLKADRILRTLKGTGLLLEPIRSYDFEKASFLVSQMLPIQYQHTLSITYYVPMEIENNRGTEANEVFFTRSIPRYVDEGSISISSENYTLPTYVDDNWKAIPVMIWSKNNTVDKEIKIPVWMNVSSGKGVNLSSPTFYLEGEEVNLTCEIGPGLCPNHPGGNSSYKVNITIQAPRLKKGSNTGIFYYAYGKTLRNEELISFPSSESKLSPCLRKPTKTCYTKDSIRKASRFDIFFNSSIPGNSTQEFYLTYSYGTNEEGKGGNKDGFLNQSGISMKIPKERMIKSTRIPSAKPETISHSSSIFLSLEKRRAEVKLKIWSQLG